jgi:hypothetical protein
MSAFGLLLPRHIPAHIVDVLLLQVAVCDVVVAPVRHRIELQAVGELHLVGLAKLLELLPSLPMALALTCPLFLRVCAPV